MIVVFIYRIVDLQASIKAISIQIVTYVAGVMFFYRFFPLSIPFNFRLILVGQLLFIAILIIQRFVAKENKIIDLVTRGYNYQPILGLLIAAIYIPQSSVLIDFYFIGDLLFIVAAIIPIIVIPLIFYFVNINWKGEVLRVHLIFLIYPLIFYLFYNYDYYQFVFGSLISLFLPGLTFFIIYIQFRLLSYRNYNMGMNTDGNTRRSNLPIISILFALIVQSLYFLNFVDQVISFSLHIITTVVIFVIFSISFKNLDVKILNNILRGILLFVYTSLLLLVSGNIAVTRLDNAGQFIGISQNGSYFFVVTIPFGFITVLEFLQIQDYRRKNKPIIGENTEVLYPDSGIHDVKSIDNT